jgi:mercuric ion transport protein
MKTSGEDLLSPHLERMAHPESNVGTQHPERTTTVVTTSGGLLAAFLASLCCLGPLVLAALGAGVGATGFLAGTASALKTLLPYRPYFIGMTVVLLGVTFYQVYRKPKSICAPKTGCAPVSGLHKARVVLWVIAAMALVLILAPYWLGL